MIKLQIFQELPRCQNAKCVFNDTSGSAMSVVVYAQIVRKKHARIWSHHVALQWKSGITNKYVWKIAHILRASYKIILKNFNILCIYDYSVPA